MTGRDLSDREAQQFGWEVVRQLFVLLRIARLHGANNEAWGPALTKVQWAVNESEGINLRALDGAFYVSDVRLKVDRENYAAQEGLLKAYQSHGVGAVEIDVAFDPAHLKALLTAWGSSKPPTPEQGLELLSGSLGEYQLIRLSKAMQRTAAVEKDARNVSKAIYIRTLNAVEDVMESVKINQAFPLKRAKRVMQRLVDNLLGDPVNLLGLTNLRCYDEYTYHHSVNVCVLSLSVGRRLGLPRPMLANLGIASLFHDLGKSRVPVEVLNKAGEFDEAEWDMIRRHPVYGVKTIVQLKGADELASRVVTGSFEHHMNFDHSGYPKLPRPRTLSLYGRVISMCDCYDAMTSARVYNRTPATPERALKLMLGKSGKAFDSVLMKVFVNTVGIFPVGTLLLLDSGEIGVVFQASEDPTQGDRPYVRMITDVKGRELSQPVDISLTETTAGGRFARNITRILDPKEVSLDVAEFFL
ncbi:MAG: HD-GYP domain-containing protein [Nitrospirota bacterium]|nr:HD-GYP domain-containing protein [Nitrospirota bacterium]